MLKDLLGAHVNLYRGSHTPQPIATLSIAQALDRIRDGYYRRQLQHLQRVLARQGKPAYDRAKRSLEAVTFCGTFAPKRGIEHLVQHSGIVHGDLDYVLDVSAAKRALAADPRTLYVFISPSGTGLKVGIRIAPVAADSAYKYAWQAVATEYARLYGIPWDPSGKDVSRLCYVSDDPDLYTNPHAEVFDVPPAPPPNPEPLPKAPSVVRSSIDHHDYAARAIRTAVEMIQAAPLGTRHHTRLKAARLLGGYVAGGLLDYQDALSALSRALERATPKTSPVRSRPSLTGWRMVRPTPSPYRPWKLSGKPGSSRTG